MTKIREIYRCQICGNVVEVVNPGAVLSCCGEPMKLMKENTILAVGTSLPELMTCVVAAAKKKGQLALGNIVGSNVFNILLILGISGLIHPLYTSSFNYVDMATIVASVLALFIFANASKKSQLSKPAGISFLLMEVVYMIYLFLKF